MHSAQVKADIIKQIQTLMDVPVTQQMVGSSDLKQHLDQLFLTATNNLWRYRDELEKHDLPVILTELASITNHAANEIKKTSLETASQAGCGEEWIQYAEKMTSFAFFITQKQHAFHLYLQEITEAITLAQHSMAQITPIFKDQNINQKNITELTAILQIASETHDLSAASKKIDELVKNINLQMGRNHTRKEIKDSFEIAFKEIHELIAEPEEKELKAAENTTQSIAQLFSAIEQLTPFLQHDASSQETRLLIDKLNGFYQLLQTHPSESEKEHLANTLTTLLQNKLLEEKIADINVNNTQLIDALYKTAVSLAKILPKNTIDPITQEMIPDDFAVYTSDRFQFDIRGLSNWINENGNILNPLTRKPFITYHDTKQILSVAANNHITIELKTGNRLPENPTDLDLDIIAKLETQDQIDFEVRGLDNNEDVRAIRELYHYGLRRDHFYDDSHRINTVSRGGFYPAHVDYLITLIQDEKVTPVMALHRVKETFSISDDLLFNLIASKNTDELSNLLIQPRADGKNLLHLAIQSSNTKIVETLVHGVHAEALHTALLMKDGYNRTPFMFANEAINPSVFLPLIDTLSNEEINTLIAIKDHENFTLLHIAAFYFDLATFELFVAKASAEAINTAQTTLSKLEFTPLHFAAAKLGSSGFLSLIAKMDSEAVNKALITKEGDPNSLLAMAIRLGSESLQILLTKASKDAINTALLTKDHLNITPLFLAANLLDSTAFQSLLTIANDDAINTALTLEDKEDDTSLLKLVIEKLDSAAFQAVIARASKEAINVAVKIWHFDGSIICQVADKLDLADFKALIEKISPEVFMSIMSDRRSLEITSNKRDIPFYGVSLLKIIRDNQPLNQSNVYALKTYILELNDDEEKRQLLAEALNPRTHLGKFFRQNPIGFFKSNEIYSAFTELQVAFEALNAAPEQKSQTSFINPPK